MPKTHHIDWVVDVYNDDCQDWFLGSASLITVASPEDVTLRVTVEADDVSFSREVPLDFSRIKFVECLDDDTTIIDLFTTLQSRQQDSGAQEKSNELAASMNDAASSELRRLIDMPFEELAMLHDAQLDDEIERIKTDLLSSQVPPPPPLAPPPPLSNNQAGGRASGPSQRKMVEPPSERQPLVQMNLPEMRQQPWAQKVPQYKQRKPLALAAGRTRSRPSSTSSSNRILLV